MDTLLTLTEKAQEHRDNAKDAMDRAFEWQRATSKATNTNARRSAYNEARGQATRAYVESTGAVRAAEEAYEQGDKKETSEAMKAAHKACKYADKADEAAEHAYDIAYEEYED